MADGKVIIDSEVDDKGVEKGLKGVQKRLKSTGERLNEIGTNMTKYVTTPIVGVGAAAFKAASDVSSASRIMQTGLGLTKEEVEALTEVARNVYKRGFGESLDEVSRAIVSVRNNFGDLVDDANLETVTADAIALAEVLEEDVNWVSRAGSQLMKEFGVSSTEAFDLMAWGAQNGLNNSEELLDNITEYGPLFAQMGFSAEEYFQLLANGVEEGAYNLDFLNDVVKEFGIRIADDSTKTNEAMSQMSEGTQKLFEEFKNGKATAAEVMQAVINDLGQMDDYTANLLGVELFGTKWEDLGNDAVLALGNIGGEIDNLDGRMNDITTAQEESFGQQFQSLLRSTMDALVPVGEVLLEIAKDVLPILIGWMSQLAEWLQGLNPSVVAIGIAFGTLLAAIGPLLVILSSAINVFMSIVPVVTQVWNWFSKLSKIFTVVRTVIAALTGPVGIVIAIITALISVGVALYKNWDTVRAVTMSVWNAISNFFSTVLANIRNMFTSAVQTVSNLINTAWNGIRNVTSSVWNGIKNLLSSIWNGIKNIVSTVVNTIKNGISSGWNMVKSITSSVFNSVRNVISSIWNGIKSFISNVLGNIVSGVRSSFNNVVNAVKSRISNVKNSIKNGFNTALNTVKNIGRRFYQAGRNIVTSIADGIRSAISAVTSAISDVASRVRDFLPFSPAKEGPLQDIDDLNFSGPISKSILDGIPEIQKALKKALDLGDVLEGVAPAYAGTGRMVSGGDRTYNRTVNISYGDPQFRNEQDLVSWSRRMRRLRDRSMRAKGVQT